MNMITWEVTMGFNIWRHSGVSPNLSTLIGWRCPLLSLIGLGSLLLKEVELARACRSNIIVRCIYATPADLDRNYWFGSVVTPLRFLCYRPWQNFVRSNNFWFHPQFPIGKRKRRGSKLSSFSVSWRNFQYFYLWSISFPFYIWSGQANSILLAHTYPLYISSPKTKSINQEVLPDFLSREARSSVFHGTRQEIGNYRDHLVKSRLSRRNKEGLFRIIILDAFWGISPSTIG